MVNFRSRLMWNTNTSSFSARHPTKVHNHYRGGCCGDDGSASGAGVSLYQAVRNASFRSPICFVHWQGSSSNPQLISFLKIQPELRSSFEECSKTTSKQANRGSIAALFWIHQSGRMATATTVPDKKVRIAIIKIAVSYPYRSAISPAESAPMA